MAVLDQLSHNLGSVVEFSVSGGIFQRNCTLRGGSQAYIFEGLGEVMSNEDMNSVMPAHGIYAAQLRARRHRHYDPNDPNDH